MLKNLQMAACTSAIDGTVSYMRLPCDRLANFPPQFVTPDIPVAARIPRSLFAEREFFLSHMVGTQKGTHTDDLRIPRSDGARKRRVSSHLGEKAGSKRSPLRNELLEFLPGESWVVACVPPFTHATCTQCTSHGAYYDLIE